MSCDLINLVKVVDAVDANIQDQTTPDIDVYMMQPLNEDAPLALATVVDSRTVVLEPGHGAIDNNMLCLREGIHFTQFQILNVAVNTLTLDSPMDKVYTTATRSCISNKNMAVNGSVTPVVFRIAPLLGSESRWDVTRILGTILDDVEMDDGMFGGIAALINGVIFRKKNGIFKNLFNVKTNGEIAARMYDASYADKAKKGEYGFRFRRTYGGQSKSGVVIRLDSADSDELQIIIQDDLTALGSFNIIVQGHLVDE